MLPILLTIPAILATTGAETTDVKVVTPAYLEKKAEHPGCFAEHFKEQTKVVCLAAASDECEEGVRTGLFDTRTELEVEECKVCSCENGKSHEGKDCQATATICKACDDGYKLDEKTTPATCKSINTCTCTNGVAAEGLACEADATAEICASCEDFYSLKDDKTCGSAQDLTCPSDLGRIPFSEVKTTDEFICGPDSKCQYQCTTCTYKAVETSVVDTKVSRRLGAAEDSTADSEDSTAEAQATPAAKEECKFPFEYNGKWYNACTTDTGRWFAGGKTDAWCATTERSVGTYFWTSLLGGWVRCEEKSDCLAKISPVDPIIPGTAVAETPHTKTAVTKPTDTKLAVSCEEDADCTGKDETCTKKTCQSTAEPLKVNSHAAAQISIAAVLAFALSF